MFARKVCSISRLRTEIIISIHSCLTVQFARLFGHLFCLHQAARSLNYPVTLATRCIYFVVCFPSKSHFDCCFKCCGAFCCCQNSMGQCFNLDAIFCLYQSVILALASSSGRVQAGTRWRRLRIYYQLPGYCQGTILAQVTAWLRLPGSCGSWPLDILLCLAAPWPPRTTNSRTNERTIRAQERADETAPQGHGPAGQRPVTAVTVSHCCHCRPRLSV